MKPMRASLAIFMSCLVGTAVHAELACAKEKVVMMEVWASQLRESAPLWKRAEKELNINIEVWTTDAQISEKFLSMNVAGMAPDLVLYTQPVMARKGLYEPLDGYLRTAGFSKDIFEPACLKAWQWRGKQWALPVSRNHYIMMYNADIFDKAGVPRPPSHWDTPGWTWEYVRELSIKFTYDRNADGKPDIFGISGLKTPSTWPFYFGGRMVDDGDNLTIDTAVNRKAWEYMLNLNSTLVGGWYHNGTAAMMMEGSWALGDRFKPLKFPAGLAPAPKGTHAATVQYVDGIGIAKGGKNKRGAWRVIEWLMANGQKNELWLALNVYGHTPALVGSQAEWAARQKKVLGDKAGQVDLSVLWEARSYGVYPRELWHKTQPDYDRIVYGDNGLTAVMRQRKSVAQWLTEAQKNITSLAAQRRD